MNKKQKYVIVIALVLILAAVLVWLANGGEVLSKDGIWVQQPLTELDKALGQEPKLEFKEHFILGLIPHTAVFVGVIIFVSAVLFFITKFRVL